MSAANADPSTLDGGLFANNGKTVIGVAALFVVLTTVFLSLRFLSAFRFQQRDLSVEDWILVPAWALIMGACACAIFMTVKGAVGRHLAWVVRYDPKALVFWSQGLFSISLMHAPAIAIIKTSIIMLYMRIFAVDRRFRITCWCLIAFIWAWATAQCFQVIFSCTPVQYAWDKSIEGGHCIDLSEAYRWVAFPQVLHDLALLILPIPWIWSIHMTTKKKITLSSVFVVGALGIVASSIRMAEFFKVDPYADTTWISVSLTSWTLAEPSVIFVCACLPPLWHLFVRVFGSKPGSSRDRHHESSGRAYRVMGKNVKKQNHTDTIPLRDTREQTPYGLESAISGHGSTGSAAGSGIMVTKDISWTTDRAV